MKKEKKKIYQKYMLRPLIYMTAFRMMLAAIFVLTMARINTNPLAPSIAAAFLTVLFALSAFLIYLRCDGMHIPRMKFYRFKKKSEPVRNYGDMQDHIDEEVVSFDELEDDEKDFVSLIASASNMAVYLILSFIL